MGEAEALAREALAGYEAKRNRIGTARARAVLAELTSAPARPGG